jgi:peptide deformylase
MARLPIITLPDPMLRKPSAPIERVDSDLKRLIADMLETMYEAPGIGLAAVQVAIPRRLIVMDIAKPDAEVRSPIAMVNPRVVETIGQDLREHEEGCLSIPDVFASIERPNAVRVSYVDEAGKPAEMVCEGLLATVVQHEIDHLDGKLFIDFLSKLRRDRIVKKMIKAKRDAEAAT